MLMDSTLSQTRACQQGKPGSDCGNSVARPEVAGRESASERGSPQRVMARERVAGMSSGTILKTLAVVRSAPAAGP